MSTVTIQEADVQGLLDRGNGSSTYLPQAGGRVLKVSYLWGKLRIDRMPEGFTIPLPARGVGGGEMPSATPD